MSAVHVPAYTPQGPVPMCGTVGDQTLTMSTDPDAITCKRCVRQILLQWCIGIATRQRRAS